MSELAVTGGKSEDGEAPERRANAFVTAPAEP